MFLRLIAAVIGSSVFAVGLLFILLLLAGESDSQYGQRILTSAVGFTLLGVLGFLVPLRFGLSIGNANGKIFYIVPGFLVPAGTTLIMGLTGREELFRIMLKCSIIGAIGAAVALVFWWLAVGARSG